jgi:hypothetical protein
VNRLLRWLRGPAPEPHLCPWTCDHPPDRVTINDHWPVQTDPRRSEAVRCRCGVTWPSEADYRRGAPGYLVSSRTGPTILPPPPLMEWADAQGTVLARFNHKGEMIFPGPKSSCPVWLPQDPNVPHDQREPCVGGHPPGGEHRTAYDMERLAAEDGRCAYVFPPESIRCVRSTAPGQSRCGDHAQALVEPVDIEVDGAVPVGTAYGDDPSVYEVDGADRA